MAIDWSKSMQQTFEFYEVNPSSWSDIAKLDNVKSVNITRDATADTLGSATFELAESVGELYIRTYLVAKQKHEIEKIALGTHLVQTLPGSFDGKVSSSSATAYTPLTELTEDSPDLGYTILKNANVLDTVYNILVEHARAPVVRTKGSLLLPSNYTADSNNNWLDVVRSLLTSVKYHLELDPYGAVLLAPDQDLDALTPVWTFNDDNSSILYPDIDTDRDLYGIPNFVEIINSNTLGIFYSTAINEDPSSPVSTVSRGRRIKYREVNPDSLSGSDQGGTDEYARLLLKSKSTLENTITYSHGYCPVAIYDAIRMNYQKANIVNTKARVISQTIDCVTGCKVSETAVYTTSYWR